MRISISHVAIVTGVTQDGRIQTCDGNIGGYVSWSGAYLSLEENNSYVTRVAYTRYPE